MTKRFALALCVTTLLGGTQSVSAGAAPLLEKGRSGRDIVAKKTLLSFQRVGRSVLSVRRASIRRASYRRALRSIVLQRRASIRRAFYRRALRSIASRHRASMRYISLASRRTSIQRTAVVPVVNSALMKRINYVAPKPAVVVAPEAVRTTPSVQKVSLLQTAQKVRNESLINPVVQKPAPVERTNDVAPRPTVVVVPEAVRTTPSVQKVSLLQTAQKVQNESLINSVVAPVVQEPAPVEEVNAPSSVVVNEAPAAVDVPEQVPDQAITPPVITSLPNPLYDDVEEVSPGASSSLSDTLLAWEGLTALLSGKEPLSQSKESLSGSCSWTEVNTDDPILADINDQVYRLTNIPQENGGEPLLNYYNLFHTMSSEDFEKELSQHQQSVKRAAELSLALQDYEKNSADDPNRLEQVKQVRESLLKQTRGLVDLGARFDHVSRKRSEEAQLSSSQPSSSALATSQIEEREVSLPRRTSSPSVDELNESLNELIRSRK